MSVVPRCARTALSGAGGLLLVLALLVTSTLLPAAPSPDGAPPSIAPAAADPLARCATPALAPALAVPDDGDLPRVAGTSKAEVRRLAGVLRGGTTARAQAIGLMTYLAATDPGADEAERAARLGEVDLDVDGFYRRLAQVEDWAGLEPSVAAHRVTGSPDPYAYEDQWTPAVVAMAAVTGRTADALTPVLEIGAGAERICRPRADAPRGFPLPAGSGWTVEATPAPRTSQDDRDGGTDGGGGSVGGGRGASKPPSPVLVTSECGTPVLAASSGVVTVSRDRRAAGPWLVEVTRDGVTTTYSHVGRPTVTSGRPVLVGDQLATVGDFGDVSACALGFSVRTAEGVLSAAESERWLRPVPLAPARPRGPVDTSRETAAFRMATYNVLGTHLTAPGGSRPGFAPGTTRMARGLGLLEASGASVVAFQEFESPAAGVVSADGDWGLFRATPNDRFAGGSTGGNAIAWRTDTWELLDSSEFTVPYRYPLHMPVVHLKNRDTGGEVYVVGVHNPASTAKQGDQSGARAAARAEEKRQVLALEQSSGLPVVIAGDFNERGPAKCDLNASGILSPGGCGGYNGVDLIFGAGDVTLSDLTPDNRLLGGISDHPLVTAGVTIHP